MLAHEDQTLPEQEILEQYRDGRLTWAELIALDPELARMVEISAPSIDLSQLFEKVSSSTHIIVNTPIIKRTGRKKGTARKRVPKSGWKYLGTEADRDWHRAGKNVKVMRNPAGGIVYIPID